MNKIFKVIYSKTRHCYVVVSELAKSHCKTAGSHTVRNKTALTAAVLLALGAFSFAGMPTAEALTDDSVNDYFTAYDKNYFDKDGNRSTDWENGKVTNTDQDSERVGAKGTGAIAAGLYAQAGQQTVTIGNRNAGASMGSVYVGEYKNYNTPTSASVPDGQGNNYVTSVGFMSNATKYGTVAIGANASAEGEVNDIKFGETDESGTYTHSLPENPDIKGASVALGYSAKATAGNIAIGAYSDTTTTTSATETAYTKQKVANSYVSIGNSTTQRRITNVADGADATDVATVGQLQKAIAETGTSNWSLTTNKEATQSTAIKPDTTVDFSAVVDGKNGTENHKNVSISHEDSNVTIGLNKDIVLGEASEGKGGSLNVYSDSSDANNLSNHVSITGSTISVNYPKIGTDGKTTTDTRGVILGVGEDSKGGADGYIAFNNAGGHYTYLHSATDAPEDLQNRLEYVGNDSQKKYIANLDDGITFKTDSIKDNIGSNSIPMKLNQTYTFSGDFGEGKTTKDLSNGNIAVVAQHSIAMVPGGGPTTVTDDGFTVKLAKDLKGITSIGNQTTKQDGDKEVTTGAEIVLNDNGTTTISGGNVNVSQHKVTGLADGTDKTDAVTVQQLTAVKNDTTDGLANKANVDASNIGANLKGSNGTSAAPAEQITLNENAWGKALGTGSVTAQNGQLVTGGTVFNALQNQNNDLTNKLSVKEGWGINIDKTKGNTISLERNLGTNELASPSKDYFQAAGENSLILGGAATANNVYINGQPWEEQFGAYGKDSVLVGGENNKITDTGTYAVISGGFLNIASGGSSFIGGGQRNTATGSSSAVVGGEVNTASGFKSIVVGGGHNWATGEVASILGGYDHYALGEGSTVSGGQRNRAIGETSSVDGGRLNFAYGDTSQVSGGYSNYTLGNFSNSLGGRNGVVQGNGSVGIAGGSTGAGAGYALAAGYQSIVTTEAVHRTQSDDWVDTVMEGGHLIGNGYKYTDVATALGYQSTADAPSTISFGHDKGDVSGYTVDWNIEYETDSKGNVKYDDHYYPIIKSIKMNGVETNYYDTAYYNRLVKAADGIEDHDAVVMEQLKNASDVGSNIKVYQTDTNGNVLLDENYKPIEDTSDAVKTKREAAQKASEDAWAAAIGTGKVADPTTTSDTNNPETNGSKQLVTGGTVYNALQQQADNLKVNAGWGINIADEKDPKTGEVTKKNVISLKRNLLGTNTDNEKVTVKTSDTGLILGGFATNDTSLAGDPQETYGATGDDAVTVGGGDGLASGKGSVVTGGWRNSASSDLSTVVGGRNNKASGHYSMVSGGYANEASGADSSVYGGLGNKATGEATTVLGGNGNTASGNGYNLEYSVVGGGEYNTASGHASSVWGGSRNTADDWQSSVYGGYANHASGTLGAVLGGHQNYTGGQSATAVGGHGNSALGGESTSIGGKGNATTGAYATALGGRSGLVSGEYSVGILGGSTGKNAAYTLAAGYHSVVTDTGITRSSMTEEQYNKYQTKVLNNKPVSGIVVGDSKNGRSLLDKFATAVGYQATADEAQTISFGHDAGDVSGYKITWKDRNVEGQFSKGSDVQGDEQFVYGDGKEPTIEEIHYDTAYYNRLVKVADGIDDHDVVVMEQLKQYAEKDAGNIGNNLTVAPVYQTDDQGKIKEDENGNPLIDEDATKVAIADAQKTNKDAWGKALGADTFTTGTSDKATDASDSNQLVTGKTLYNYDAPSGTDLKYVSANNTTGQNLSALDSALRTVGTAHTALTVEGGIQAGTQDEKTKQDVYAGKNILLHESTDEKTGKVTYDLKLSKDINIGKPGKDGEDGKIGIDGKDGHIGLNGSDGITVRGLDGENGAPGKDGVTITGPKGEAGKDGIDGKVGISGKDGKDAISISGKDGVGHIGLTGPAGTNGKDGTNAIDITVKNGYDDKDKGINGTNGVDGKDGITRIVYTDKTGEHQVATMEDGMKYAGDDAQNDATKVITKKLNNTLDIIGGADSKNLTEKNIGVNSDKDGKLNVQLVKDLKGITSISNQKTEGDKTTGAKIMLGSDGTTTITGGDVNVGGNKVTNIKSALDGAKDADGKDATIATATGDALKNAANLGDLQKVYNDVNAKADKASASHTALTVEGGTPAGTQDEKTKQDVYAGKNILLHESTDENTGKVTYDLKLSKDINIGKPGKDGEDGKIGIDGKDGHIGLTGPAGTNGKDGTNAIDITVKDGYDDAAKGINGTNGVDGKDGITRIVYTDKTGEHQVATMEDGLKFKGDDGKVIAKKLNNTMEIIGGADSKNLTDKNIGVNNDGGKLKVQLAKDLTSITSISNQKTTKVDGKDVTTGAKITLGDDGSVDVNGGKITNVGSGIEKDANGKYTVTDQNKGNAANIGDVQNLVNDAKTELTDGANGLNKKANIDASNIGTNLKNADGSAASAEDQKANAEKWGSAIGTGKIESNNGQLVTGDTVYNEVRPKEDGNYVKKDNTTGENLSALDSKIGSLDKDGNYIKKDDSISKNLSTLDTQVKNNADAIQNITNNVKNLSDNAVQYDKDSNKSKVTLAGKDGTTITNVKDGSVTKDSKDAVNGGQLYEVNEKVTNNTNEITKIKNGNFTDASKTAIHNIAKDAVEVVNGKNTTVTKVEGTDTTPTTYAVNVEGTGKVASGDTGLISGDTLYKEVHVDKDGSYIKSSQSVGQNLSALDTGLKTTSDLIHTNDKGDTIQIGGNSTATKIDVSGKDANGNTTGRVITGVVSDASDPNSAANVGYVNGLTAANTQQIYRDMNNAYSRLDNNINKAAAGSNALAALHPLDYDPADKASFAVGYGHYHNANAAAVGAFYYPNANTMVNMGVSVGNGDPGFNAGVSFRIGKGSAYNGVSKAEMAQTIHDQAAEISTIKANDAAKDKRIDALEKENQEMKKQIQEILARLNG